MVNISADTRILASIQTGSIYYFEEEQFNSEEPHFFIVLNKNPRKDDLLVLVSASSKVEKRKEIAKKLGFPTETLVFITPLECSLFSEETVIDCNRAYEKPIKSLVEKLENGKLKVCTESLDTETMIKITNGVLVSPQVSYKVKKIIQTGD